VNDEHHPTAVADLTGGPLLERELEVAQVAERVDAAASARGSVLAIVGPAGIGKTRLLREVSRVARARGVACLEATGNELERDYSYGIVRQLFEGPVASLPPRDRTEVLSGAASLAAPLVGGGEAPEGGADGPFGMIHGLYWLCTGLAGRGPLLLLVDDLHWADEASLRFLAYLGRRVGEHPVLVAVAARPTPDPATGSLVDHIVATERALRLSPSPLSPAAVGDLLRTAIGAEPGGALAAACHEATGGNPFLCTTVASVLVDRTVLEGAGDLVASVAELRGSAVLTRIGRLPDAAASLARAVAVLGTGASLPTAAALAGLRDDEAAAAAAFLAERGVLRPVVPLDFTHPLVRGATRKEVPAAARALLHAEAARLLARDGAPPERIAAHLLAAEPASRSWVVATLRDAAAGASRSGDPAAAAAYLRRALGEPPEPAERPAILRELGVAELDAGDADAACTHLAEALRLTGDPRERARVARDLAAALAAPGRYRDAVDVLESRVAEVSGVDRGLARQLEADLHQCAMMDPALYPRVSARYGALERGLPGESTGERAILATLATEDCLASAGADAVAACALRALEPGLLADQGLHSSLWGNAAFPLVFADRLDEAATVADRAIEAARRTSSLAGVVRGYTFRAIVALRRGAIPDAEADARAAVELGLDPGLQIARIALGVLVEALVERGALADADDLLAAAGRDAEIPAAFLESWVLHARGWLRLAQARTGDAVADFAQLLAWGEEHWRPWNPGIFPVRSGLALALARQGSRERALAVARDEQDRAARWGSPRAEGVSLRTLGLVEGGETGLAHLEKAVRLLDASAAELERARALVDLGAAIRRAGRRSEAREPLASGMDLAVRCGATALAIRAREELVAAGSRPRRMHRTGVQALTASELRVARLAADGRTNRGSQRPCS
jgi:tetratricopeptide (TPR) repeat protein